MWIRSHPRVEGSKWLYRKNLQGPCFRPKNTGPSAQTGFPLLTLAATLADVAPAAACELGAAGGAAGSTAPWAAADATCAACHGTLEKFPGGIRWSNPVTEGK